MLCTSKTGLHLQSINNNIPVQADGSAIRIPFNLRAIVSSLSLSASCLVLIMLAIIVHQAFNCAAKVVALRAEFTTTTAVMGKPFENELQQSLTQ